MACKFSNFFANIKILRPPIAKIFYQAASFTYLYWSGMGCGHGMPCPYIWRCCRGARYYFHMEGCGGEVDAWGFLFEAREVGVSMTPSGAHLRRACLGLIALRLSEPFGILAMPPCRNVGTRHAVSVSGGNADRGGVLVGNGLRTRQVIWALFSLEVLGGG